MGESVSVLSQWQMFTSSLIQKGREFRLYRSYSGIGALVLASMLGLSGVAVGNDDHVVVTKKEQSLEAVIRDVLKSSQFVDHIATYNGIDAIGSMLPLGTTVRIPRPYINVLDFGQIAYVKGDVTLAKTNTVVNPPGKGALVHNGDIIRTGKSGFVSVSFNSGAQFNLQPDSVVKVSNVRCLELTEKCLIELEASKGSVTSEVQPRPEGTPPIEFSVTTPFLSAAVRGTVFYIVVDRDVHRIGVTRGLVAADSAGSAVDLPGGTGLEATESSPPSKVDLLPMPVFAGNDEHGLYSYEDIINWESIGGAQSYQVKVAHDPAIAEIALMSEVDHSGFAAALSGDYFLSVAAVDDSDFTGLPLVKQIRFADIADESQPELRIERREGVVSLQLTGKSADYNGPMQLFIGNSIDGNAVQVETIADLSKPVTYNLDEKQTWVFRARKLMGPYTVSAYSNHYQLHAR